MGHSVSKTRVNALMVSKTRVNALMVSKTRINALMAIAVGALVHGKTIEQAGAAGRHQLGSAAAARRMR